MNDSRPKIRDRTLILRVLVPGLEARLRDKMNENKANKILDLEGVTCEPTPARNHTLWSFSCDGATYPARLVNLPNPIELHKTLEHSLYYKSCDVAQMLIVYEDDMALEEADEPVEGFPSYFHSGITPPLKKVVEKRFAAREHTNNIPPRAFVQDVETELLKTMEQLATNEKATKRNKLPVLTSANKVLEVVTDDIVDYEPWMEDGIEFDSEEKLCSLHPEVWLPPQTIQTIVDEENKKRRKSEKKKKKPPKVESVAATSPATTTTTNMVDDVEQAALMMADGDGMDDLVRIENDFEWLGVVLWM